MVDKDRLQVWALVAEIIGGMAVVLSLIFVGLEISQSTEETALNTRVMEVNAFQDLISQINQINLARLANPEMLELTPTLTEDIEPANDREHGYLFTTASYIIRHGEMAFFQYQQGLIDEVRLGSALAILRGVLSTNWGQERWMSFLSLDPEYIHYVETMMAERFPDEPFWQKR